MLGVAMIDISDAPKGEDSKPALKWPTRRGSMVARVTKGSPADKAGLESLDIITHVNDERVLDHKEASAALASLKPDEEVELR